MVLLLLSGAALRQGSVARLEAAWASAERDAESDRLAVLAERARIARDLHDVVAHHMALISIQAQAAPVRDPDLSESSRRAFTLIEHAAREALSETRGIVGLLRGDSSAAQSPDRPAELSGPDHSPAPGLSQIPALVDRARSSGMQVDLAMSGTDAPLPAATALTAYRMVQEALANAARHAPGTPVKVELSRQGAALNVDVVNASTQGRQP
jgi:signal transduction histidine kinase